jgi:cytoskeletal protein CcmA (bactofilin family)
MAAKVSAPFSPAAQEALKPRGWSVDDDPLITMGWRSKSDTASASTDQIENVLGKSLHVQGDLKAQGAFRIDGTVDGAVESQGAVIVGEGGVVNGNVRGRDIVVAGHVCGNVTATGHLDIVASGRIEGDIDAKSFRIETGGVFRGTSRMGDHAGQDPAALAHLASVK